MRARRLHRRSSKKRTGWRTGLAGILAAMVVLLPTAAQAQEVIWASDSYGIAAADFDWTGPGLAEHINLDVSDRGCDANPVYAYFKVINTNGRTWTTQNRYDYSGCDLEDHTTYNGLSVSDGFNIEYLQIYICVRNGPCHAGGTSERNPYS
jgi:hypothetical protein